jgi:EpsI family protein
MIAEKTNSRQLVVYWFKAGALNTDQYIQQQLKVVLGRMMGKRTSGALIRLSIDIKNNDEATALKTLREFVSQTEPLLPKYIP